jgi:hypothetical protein
MDRFTLIAEIIKAVAWPISTLVIMLVLRKPTLALVEGLRLARLKYGDWEAEFDHKAQGVQKNLEAASGTKALPAGPPPPPQLEEAIASSPTAVVVTAWADLESTVKDIGAKMKITGPSQGVIRELNKRGLVTAGTMSAIEGLRQMRNLVVHAPNGAASLARAQEFATMAEAMAWTIQQELGKAQMSSP